MQRKMQVKAVIVALGYALRELRIRRARREAVVAGIRDSISG